ncbi:pyridoxamine kinase [Acetanaerobacterium elongatum]|uniref:pyridoxal kinase n=1 Tax=Acetanaerobacterium elongatum TaxID=258515 RepID=A0A1H0AJE6_9FIRM|nr:pyridoxamine kinase [Acetanaerobacterium elongatum]SDN32916.1 pyridoxine kinase [Acetanaerobacterium elongatum]
MKPQKRVCAVHDISCFGKCSLTVALPILSAAGVETSVIPTAVLSTHTGGFTGYTYRDLTEDIPAIGAHWKTLNLHFDSLYTGFLGSFEQLELVARLIDDFKSGDTLVLVDPVMADNGSLYKVFSSDFPKGMAKLCGKADVIVPNITEAALLTGLEYREGPHTTGYIEALLRGLGKLVTGKVVLTGVCMEDNALGCAAYDPQTGKIDYILSPRVAGIYHGTGDIFASALLGALLNGFALSQAARVAVDFTVSSILRTKEAGTDVRFGVNFEYGIPTYVKALGLI